MIRVRQVKVLVEEDCEEVLLARIAKKLSLQKSDIQHYEIVKKSIDARNKEAIYYVYEVDVLTDQEKMILRKKKDVNLFLTPKEEYQLPVPGDKQLTNRIVIVGSGPAGLFCAYLLAQAGYHPLIVERGERMEKRVQAVQHFFETNQLDVHSNVQFGEGGAGTFSDGKLNTLVKDKAFRGKKAFEIFIENGAPKEILYESKPHIGTDLLRDIIIRMRNKIIDWGGEFLYDSTVTDIVLKEGHVQKIEINHKEMIPCEVLVLAIGHSARDTFSMLLRKGLSMKAKNFAVGLRIIHPQKMIDESQYGKYAKMLPPASYKLVYQTKKGRSVYSFCMCPGGYVVNASSEDKRLVVNGMSNHKRDGINANSAIVVSVTQNDFGEGVLAGVEFQRKLEELAYQLGNGLIPVQLYGDYCNKIKSTQLGSVLPTTMGAYTLANLDELFPDTIREAIMEAIPYFGSKIKGFDREDALLLGVESRTSSPVFMERNEQGESNLLGLYPCGEGAGYAGGITTSAMDGIKIAEEIIKKYKV